MKNLILLTILLMFTRLHAQNLINNWSFESSKNGKAIKPKAPGMIEESMGWSSPTTNKADLYSRDSKELPFQVPVNQYGRQDVDDGGVYAGIITYGDKEKTPKTYIQTQLTQTLQEGMFYCVNFKVSLSDLSKVANNNIGAYFSASIPTAESIKGYQITPQVTNKGNKIVDDQYLWTEICGMFKAKGGENYITIGNFANDANTQIIKVKKPKEFMQQQIPQGYYFIDDVQLYASDSLTGCKCKDTETKEDVKMIYKKDDSDDLESNPVKIVEYKSIYFDAKMNNLNKEATDIIGIIVKVMNEKPESKIKIFASTDKQEEATLSKSNIDLSKKRCDAVIKVLESKGIAKERLIPNPVKDTMSKETKDAKEMQKFRRVWFEVAK